MVFVVMLRLRGDADSVPPVLNWFYAREGTVRTCLSFHQQLVDKRTIKYEYNSVSWRQDKMDKPDKLMDLPNEVLVEIFKHVDGTTLNEELVLVCKKFNSLVKATKPLFTMENNGIVMGRVGHKKVKAALSKNDHLYIQSISIKGLESLTDLAKNADLVKNQPGLKSVLLSGDFIATSQREALRADRELKKAILSLKYLEFLCLTGLEVSTRFQNNLTKRLRCPHNRKSTHISSWSKNDLKKLESKKRLSILSLPKITAEAFNYLMEDSDAEVFRHTVKYFDISGLHWNWIWPEPEVSWKNLRHFKRLSLLTAGEVDGDFWTALPMLTKLNELSLELSMAGLSKIVPTINDHPTQVTSLHLLCDDSIVWKNVREDIRQTFFSYFPKVCTLLLLVYTLFVGTFFPALADYAPA